jgi:outer membrane protein
LAAGGREINFPIGDLLNPVYGTLNQQLVAAGQSPQFPVLENQKVRFLPNNFYDARVRTIYPIFNPDIALNKENKALMLNYIKPDKEMIAKDLERDIKISYYKYLQTVEGLKIINNAISLLNEVKRINESMVRNDIAIPSILLRVKNDISKIEAQKIELLNNQKNAKLYFNTLINSDLEANINIDTTLFSGKNITTFQTQKIDVSDRAEIAKVNEGLKLLALKSKFEQAFTKPRIGSFMDLGSQGYVYKNGPKLYGLAGVTLEYPIYDAGKNKKRIEQAQLDEKALLEQKEFITKQLTLQESVAQNNLSAAQEILATTDAQVDMTKRYYRDVQKRFKEGQAIYLEVSDAHTQLLNAALQQSVSVMNIWIRGAELERLR